MHKHTNLVISGFSNLINSVFLEVHSSHVVYGVYTEGRIWQSSTKCINQAYNKWQILDKV